MTFPQRDTGTPTYDGLPLGRLCIGAGDAQSHAPLLVRRALEQADAWRMAATGRSARFCDVSLDYIGRYDRPWHRHR
jgi:hypothetical protein